jgi:hypothetical protein
VIKNLGGSTGGGGGSGISSLTSTGGTVTITNPSGPTTNVEVANQAPTFANSVSAAPATTQNNYAPAGFTSATTRLLLTAAAGDSTITGLLATGFADGQSLLIRNMSSTDQLVFPHLSGSSAATNQFSNSQGQSASLPPLTSAILTYIVNVWAFSS